MMKHLTDLHYAMHSPVECTGHYDVALLNSIICNSNNQTLLQCKQDLTLTRGWG